MQLLRFGRGRILEVRMGRPDRTRDPIDLVPAPVNAPRLVEHAIFGEDLVDGRAPTRGVVFTEDVVKIAGQQGRYAVGHGLSPLGIECGLRYLDRIDTMLVRWFPQRAAVGKLLFHKPKHITMEEKAHDHRSDSP